MPKAKQKQVQSTKLGRCWICHTVEAIYTCPRCDTVTCSLNCVKQHKKQLDCDGVRVRSKYVSLDKMNELNLLSDYRLLEDIGRCVDNAEKIRDAIDNPRPETTTIGIGVKEKNETENAPRRTNNESKRQMHLNRKKADYKENLSKPLSGEVAENGDGSEHLQPKTFSESSPSPMEPSEHEHLSQNLHLTGEECADESVLHKRTRTVNRKIVSKGRLASAVRKTGAPKQKVLDTLMKAAFSRGTVVSFVPETFAKHRENTSIFLGKENCIYWRLKVSYINANFFTVSIDSCPESMILEHLIIDSLSRSRSYHRSTDTDDPLVLYSQLGISKISVLMVADKLPGSQNKFYMLDKTKSLRENLEGKCVVEFPHLCIALEDCYVVSKIKENIETCFFDSKDCISTADEESMEEEEAPARKKKRKLKHKTDGEADRESGELTESSDDSVDDDSSSESEGNELYDDSEFRSMYRDLLTTFDVDVGRLQ